MISARLNREWTAAWNSLRVRLLLSTSVAIALVLGLLAFSIYFSMWHSLAAEFNVSLLAQAQTIQAMCEQGNGKVKFEFDSQQVPEFAAKDRPAYFEMWTDDGKPLACSASLGDGNLSRDLVNGQSPSYGRIMLPDGRHGRYVAVLFTPRVEHHGISPGAVVRSVNLVVARDFAVVHDTMSNLSEMLWGLFTAAILVSGAVLLTVVGRAVRPVKRLAGEIGSLGETDLGRRLRSQNVPQELSPVVEKLNGLLGRLEAAFSREKSFTDNVAHELRTPLAGLRTTLEVCRSRPRNVADYEAALDECQKMTDRMEAMVENLLMMARADAGQLTVEHESLDLCMLAQECWALFENLAHARGLRVDLSLTGPCQIMSDPEKLRIVLHNLFDNAVSYAEEGGKLFIGVARRASSIEMLLSNSGSLIAAEDAPRLFDRFWRGDESRTDTGLHCGLGLSLCKRLLALLEGEIGIETVHGGEFSVRLRFPAAE